MCRPMVQTIAFRHARRYLHSPRHRRPRPKEYCFLWYGVGNAAAILAGRIAPSVHLGPRGAIISGRMDVDGSDMERSRTSPSLLNNATWHPSRRISSRRAKHFTTSRSAGVWRDLALNSTKGGSRCSARQSGPQNANQERTRRTHVHADGKGRLLIVPEHQRPARSSNMRKNSKY